MPQVIFLPHAEHCPDGMVVEAETGKSIVALGLMWLRIAEAAQKALDEGRGDTTFLEAKLVTARHFGERFIPDAGALRRKIEAGSEAMMALTPEQFVGA